MSAPDASAMRCSYGLLRWQFRLMHRLLDMAGDEISAEQSRGRSPGIIARAGACYAQIAVCEDVSVHSALAVGLPLALTNWAGRTGLSELPPLVGPIDWRAWTCRVQLADVAALRAYAQAVHMMTDTCLAALADDALDPPHDALPARLLGALLLTMAMRHGEIACLLSTSSPRAAAFPGLPTAL
ncbi:MAG TPA: hypothetical protein VJO13_10345 [Ktedonobacterales bacterium]|nr:hypothetical protein [Ktedonobacterales bacterium]